MPNGDAGRRSAANGWGARAIVTVLVAVGAGPAARYWARGAARWAGDGPAQSAARSTSSAVKASLMGPSEVEGLGSVRRRRRRGGGVCQAMSTKFEFFGVGRIVFGRGEVM